MGMFSGGGGSGGAADGAAGPFSELESGTNTTAAMVVGSGASLNPSGTGVVNASQLDGLDVDMSSAAEDDFVVVDASGDLVLATPGLEARTDADGTAALLSTDRGKQLNVSHATANAVSIAQAGTAGFEAGYVAYLCQTRAGAVTLTPTTSTVNGGATLVFDWQYSCARIRSDGTNYEAVIVPPVGTPSGTGATIVTTTGAQTSGDCVEIDANGNHVASGAACGGGSANVSVVEADYLNESLTNSVTSDQDFTTLYTIPANQLILGTCYEIEVDMEATTGTTTATWTLYLRVGGTKLWQSSASNIADGITLRRGTQTFRVCGTAAAGAAVDVVAAGPLAEIIVGGANNSQIAVTTRDTTGTLALVLGVVWDATGSTEVLTVRTYTVTKRSL